MEQEATLAETVLALASTHRDRFHLEDEKVEAQRQKGEAPSGDGQGEGRGAGAEGVAPGMTGDISVSPGVRMSVGTHPRTCECERVTPHACVHCVPARMCVCVHVCTQQCRSPLKSRGHHASLPGLEVQPHPCKPSGLGRAFLSLSFPP